jgi:hypothetical protein
MIDKQPGSKLSTQAAEAKDWKIKKDERVAQLTPGAKKVFQNLHDSPNDFYYRGEISKKFMDGGISADEEAAFKVYMEEVALRQFSISSSFYGSEWDALWKSDKFRRYAQEVAATNPMKYEAATEILMRSK